MTDRGEKIVTLAREMLRAEELGCGLTGEPRQPLSFKVLCFTAILAALGSSGVTRLAIQMQRPLNRYEKFELDALVFYAARTKNVDEAALRREVEQRVGTGNFEDFTAYDYRIAKHYLRGEIR